jgi:hypothetical protein
MIAINVMHVDTLFKLTFKNRFYNLSHKEITIMATRSTIAVLLPDNTVRQIYCHWDGYFSCNGKILFEHYSDINKLKEMMAKGFMSSLENTIDGCKFYNDRGEDTKCNTFLSYDEYVLNHQDEEYNYIFKDNKWYEITRGVTLTKSFLDKTND